jgi:hypothetical protein
MFSPEAENLIAHLARQLAPADLASPAGNIAAAPTARPELSPIYAVMR